MKTATSKSAASLDFRQDDHTTAEGYGLRLHWYSRFGILLRTFTMTLECHICKDALQHL